MMRTITKGLVLAITCIMLISSMPVVLAASSLGGTSATTQHGGGMISGTSQVTGNDIIQSGDVTDDTVGGIRSLSAVIQSEVEVPEGKTGDAKVDWTVPVSSQSTQSVTHAASAADLGYTLTVSANGITSASVTKTSTTGVGYSLAQIVAEATMDTDPLSGTGLTGTAIIQSQGFMTGTGTISSTAEGVASFDAIAQSALGTTSDVSTSGSVTGAATLDAENVKGGIIGIATPTPSSAIMSVVTVADPTASNGDTASVVDDNEISLDAARNVAGSSGTTSAIASVAGTSDGKASTTDLNDPNLGTASAGVGCNEPITIDMTGTVSTPARGDTASSNTQVQVTSNAAPYVFGGVYSATANAVLSTNSLSQRTATCCVNGEIALATSQIVNAVWDATTITPSDGSLAGTDAWQVCIDGATGLTRDGSTVPTEPGYASGSTSMNRKGAITSTITTTQGANVDAAGTPTTTSFTSLDMTGPKYTATSSIEDAVGSRFAIDKMDMTAGGQDATPADRTLVTNIVGPDAYLWITGDNAQTLNGHYAMDTYSVYDVAFDPAGSGIITGPDLTVQSVTFPRSVTLNYGTDQA